MEPVKPPVPSQAVNVNTFERGDVIALSWQLDAVVVTHARLFIYQNTHTPVPG